MRGAAWRALPHETAPTAGARPGPARRGGALRAGRPAARALGGDAARARRARGGLRTADRLQRREPVGVALPAAGGRPRVPPRRRRRDREPRHRARRVAPTDEPAPGAPGAGRRGRRPDARPPGPPARAAAAADRAALARTAVPVAPHRGPRRARPPHRGAGTADRERAARRWPAHRRRPDGPTALRGPRVAGDDRARHADGDPGAARGRRR